MFRRNVIPITHFPSIFRTTDASLGSSSGLIRAWIVRAHRTCEGTVSMTSRRCRIAFATAVAVSAPVVARAQTTADWLNPVSGSWFDATKWSTNPFAPNNGSPPGATYIARLGATGAPYTVDLNGATVTLDALHVTSPDAELRLHLAYLGAGLIELDGHIRADSSTIADATLSGSGSVSGSGVLRL